VAMTPVAVTVVMVPMAMPAAMPDLLDLTDFALGDRRGRKGGGRSRKRARRKGDETAGQRCDEGTFHVRPPDERL
jgi:hypothetical protein